MVSWDESRNLTPFSLSENGEQLSQSDSSQSVINSARDNVNSTINPDVGLEITNDSITYGGEKSNYMKRRRKHKTYSLTMEAVEKFFGKQIDEAAASLAVSVSTLKRFCREHGMLSWPLPKHNKIHFYVVVLMLVRTKRWSCSSKHHGLSGKWWSCGQHKYAMQNNDHLVMSTEQIVASVVSDNNKASKKRKRIDLSVSSLEEIREHCGKTMEKVMNYFGVGTGKLRCIWQWWSYTKSPKLIQAPVVTNTSEEAPTSVVAASNEPVGTTNITHDRSTLVLHQQETMREQFIENATTSTVKILTIKATYNENMVKFPFTLLDGLVKLKEMVATRFQLKPGSFKLKYEDKDGDEILIACDTDLMGSVGDSKQPVNSSVIRLLVLSVAPKSINA